MINHRLTRKSQKYKPANTYGFMILPEGLILYHKATTPTFETKIKERPMIFFTFHPSEWRNLPDETYTTIKLNKPLKLFFMVDYIGHVIKSLLPTLINQSFLYASNLDKNIEINLNRFLPYLKAENFDGWFSSVECRMEVEVGLINDSSYYTILSKTEPKYNPISDLRYMKFRYPIHTKDFPILLNINEKYKDEIEKYMKKERNYPFQIVLENAKITYFNKPIKHMIWI